MRRRGLFLISMLLVAVIISVSIASYFGTHSLCRDDTGQWYFSSAPPASALPCGLEPGPNIIVKSSQLSTNGSFQFVIGDAGPSVTISSLTMSPGFSTAITTETEVTTTCDGCSTQTFTFTSTSSLPCIGLVPLVSYSYVTESCAFSGVPITAGQAYEFDISFSNGPPLVGQVTAQ